MVNEMLDEDFVVIQDQYASFLSKSDNARSNIEEGSPLPNPEKLPQPETQPLFTDARNPLEETLVMKEVCRKREADVNHLVDVAPIFDQRSLEVGLPCQFGNMITLGTELIKKEG